MSPVATASEGSKPQTNVRIQAKLAIRPEESVRGDPDRLHSTIQVASPVWNKLGGNVGGAGTFYAALSCAGSGQRDKRTEGSRNRGDRPTDRQTDRQTSWEPHPGKKSWQTSSREKGEWGEVNLDR